MEAAHVRLGRLGEDAALAHYRDAGYELVARNWRCRVGELDLVLSTGRTLVFCEVKTRRGDAYGAGYEAVTDSKQARLRRLARIFLSQGAGSEPPTVRFDVASVIKRPGRAPQVEVYQDAF
jgi:putative endonuclease